MATPRIRLYRSKNQNGTIFCPMLGCKEPLLFGKRRCGVHSRGKYTSAIFKVFVVPKTGYEAIKFRGAPKIMGHILIAEKAAGIPLVYPMEVHHANEVRSDNRNLNLVICQDRAYHQLLHIRSRAYDACGNANWRKCSVCKEYDDTAKMSLSYQWTTEAYYHRKCQAEYSLARYYKKMARRRAVA